MAKKKRQRISYVLPLANTPGGHRLGVNGLAYDEDRSILYTGGRDGAICAWDLDLNAPHTPREASSSLPHKRRTAQFRKQVQAHTHWVNDLVLVKNSLALVSASSDASVKLWRPHSSDATTAYTIGSHSDYIKCLTTPGPAASWVASGGLDHKICLWDLAGGGQTLEINVKAENAVKGSVYALRARGSVIASGGPESVVRLWDANSGKGITKLVGHTDNVRDILMSDDGDTLLTASSDQTVKVWSMAAGRCMHTLTMHNDSVWCMYSNDPTLSVFYSADRSGLVAKTDVRRAKEIEEGLSVAVCQEHAGIARLLAAGDSVWTATSSSSINRWRDVNTELEVETPPTSPRHERTSSTWSRSVHAPSPPDSPRFKVNGTLPPRIPHNAVLLVSNAAIHPGRKLDRLNNASLTTIRKASEAIMDNDLSLIIPVRGHPEETIEGQNGLIKHVMLNDRKRVLTLDTAGEVVLWDLLKCVPIQSFGRRYLDEVVSEVNTIESVANWCAVNTKTGKLAVMLEENYCFDAEVYADEIDIPEKIDFRDDQRINLGKWVLRNLFTNLLDEEIRRDEAYRKRIQAASSGSGRLQRSNAPTAIALPDAPGAFPTTSPGNTTTPRPANGLFGPSTPGLSIALATPAAPLTKAPTLTTEEGSDSEKAILGQSQPTNNQDPSSDYFSSATASKVQSETSSEATLPPTPGGGAPAGSLPTSPVDDKKKGTIFGKKFQMTFPKKLARTSAEVVKAPVASGNDEKQDELSDKSSEKEEPLKVMSAGDNLFGVVEQIRQRYREQLELEPDTGLSMGITPSLPSETPILRPPPHTMIIIQEDDPDSGGLTDLYRGEISELGKEADTLEKVAPTWLGQLILKNEIPAKEMAKVSFALYPYQNLLPPIASDGSSRLNANRMLRAKKILAYVAERIEAPPAPPSSILPAGAGVGAAASANTESSSGANTNRDSLPHSSSHPTEPVSQPPSSSTPKISFDSSSASSTDSTDEKYDSDKNSSSPTSNNPLRDPAPDSATTVPSSTTALPTTPTATTSTPTATADLKPEDYLDLICQGQKIDPNTTLATLRVHVWRTGGDVALYYRANGRKEIKMPHPADVAGKDEGMGTLVTGVGTGTTSSGGTANGGS